VGGLRELAQRSTSDTVVHDVEVSALLGRGAEQLVLLGRLDGKVGEREEVRA